MGGFQEIVPIHSLTHPLLLKRPRYWLTAKPANFSETFEWWVPSTLEIGLHGNQLAGSHVWNVASERQRGFEITESAPSSVPEPALLAFRLGGAGLQGRIGHTIAVRRSESQDTAPMRTTPIDSKTQISRFANCRLAWRFPRIDKGGA